MTAAKRSCARSPIAHGSLGHALEQRAHLYDVSVPLLVVELVPAALVALFDALPLVLVLSDLAVSEDEFDVALAEAVDDRESVMYQPLPLKTIPTGWMTFRRVPPHCSQVVSGASKKLWRFSRMALQMVQE